MAAAEFQRAVGRMNDRAASAHARGVAECEKLVYALYPETEGHVPLEERKGTIPAGIKEEIAANDAREAEKPKKKGKRLFQTKNATPGDAAQDISSCLDDVRPKAFTVDLNPSDCSSPDLIRAGALERYGQLEIQTGNKLMSQWRSIAHYDFCNDPKMI